MSTVHGLIPRPREDIDTMVVTPGMVMGYNPKFVAELSLERLAAAVVHEASHVLRGYFNLIDLVDEKDLDLLALAADLPLNDDLKTAGWDTAPNWMYSATFGFPPGKTTMEYFDMLRQERAKGDKLEKLLSKLLGDGDQDGGGAPGQQPGEGGGPGQGTPKQSPGQHGKGVGRGGCGGSKSLSGALDGEKDEDGKTIGRGSADRTRIIRQTIEETKQHMVEKGRGSVPSFLSELVDLEMKPSRIPWRDRVGYIIRETSGPIISGGDDYSMRHPSKRSHVRRLIRPGLIDCLPNVLFILDTSGSMSARQMRDGVDESVAVLSQLGIDEGWFCQVDAAVAEEPRKVTLSELSGAIEFKGRGGTDFGPGFRAAMRMLPRPDIIIYFTDGDGWAPRTPCPIPTIWAIVPRTHYTRRPAAWGMVVTITDDEKHPDDDEASFQPPIPPPTNYEGWGDGIDETDPAEYEQEEEEGG
jgi:predicted metal-dependent peptidase